MDNLARLLGLAPSEMLFEDLILKVKRERDRVRNAINEWRMGINLKPVKEKKLKTSTKKASAKAINNEYEEIKNLLKSLGLEG